MLDLPVTARYCGPQSSNGGATLSRHRLTCGTAEVARLYGVERHCLSRMAKAGVVPEPQRVGRRFVWRKSELAADLGVSLDDLNDALASHKAAS